MGTEYRWLTLEDLKAHQALEDECRAFDKDKLSEAFVTHLSATEKQTMVQGPDSGIAGVWLDDELIAYASYLKCDLVDHVRLRFALLSGIATQDCIFLRSGVVAPKHRGQHYMSSLLQFIIDNANRPDLPVAFITDKRHKQVQDIGALLGFKELAPVRREDGVDMVLFLRPPTEPR